MAENLHFDLNSKRAVFNAHGLLYDGDIMGVKKEGTTIYRADSGIMTGAAIATRDYFGAGSYKCSSHQCLSNRSRRCKHVPSEDHRND